MKKLLWILGGLALVIGAGVLIIFYATSGLTKTADTFFADVGAGDMAAARGLLSQAFRDNTSEDALQHFLEQDRLMDYQSASWSSRSVTLGSGQLEGSINTRSGGKIPIKLSFVKEDGWKIYAIERPAAGVSQGGSSVPSRDESAHLVAATTHAFGEAINAKDFSGFHENASPEFQHDVSVGDLAKNFAAFMEQEIDLTSLDNLKPVFTADPGLDGDGILHLEGYYPSHPLRALFEYKYVYRGTGWKLLGISLNLQPVSS